VTPFDFNDVVVNDKLVDMIANTTDEALTTQRTK
jgi:hypothetical protein